MGNRPEDWSHYPESQSPKPTRLTEHIQPSISSDPGKGFKSVGVLPDSGEGAALKPPQRSGGSKPGRPSRIRLWAQIKIPPGSPLIWFARLGYTNWFPAWSQSRSQSHRAPYLQPRKAGTQANPPTSLQGSSVQTSGSGSGAVRNRGGGGKR